MQQSPCSRYIWFFLINNFDSLKDTSCWECYYAEVNLMCEAVSVLVFCFLSFFLFYLFIFDLTSVIVFMAPAGLMVGDPERFGGGDVP